MSPITMNGADGCIDPACRGQGERELLGPPVGVGPHRRRAGRSPVGQRHRLGVGRVSQHDGSLQAADPDLGVRRGARPSSSARWCRGAARPARRRAARPLSVASMRLAYGSARRLLHHDQVGEPARLEPARPDRRAAAGSPWPARPGETSEIVSPGLAVTMSQSSWSENTGPSAGPGAATTPSGARSRGWRPSARRARAWCPTGPVRAEADADAPSWAVTMSAVRP